MMKVRELTKAKTLRKREPLVPYRGELQWALDAAARRYVNFALAKDASVWSFAVDAVIDQIVWLAVMDVTAIRHPTLRKFKTGVHGKRLRPLLTALISYATGRDNRTKNRARLRIIKARGTLLSAIEGRLR